MELFSKTTQPNPVALDTVKAYLEAADAYEAAHRKQREQLGQMPDASAMEYPGEYILSRAADQPYEDAGDTLRQVFLDITADTMSPQEQECALAVADRIIAAITGESLADMLPEMTDALYAEAESIQTDIEAFEDEERE